VSAHRPFRAGDVVIHEPTGEEWVLACDEDNGDVYPAGWPTTIARAGQCRIVWPAWDNTRVDMLRSVAACGCPVRSARARRDLEETE
jgi:hypothetical protein